METAVTTDDRTRSGKTVATVVYALYAASLFLAITALVGIVVNYVKKDDVAGTWVESHFRWQIRTFWYALLWVIVGSATAGIGIGVGILLAVLVWFIYRIVKGWLRLNDNKPMYAV